MCPALIERLLDKSQIELCFTAIDVPSSSTRQLSAADRAAIEPDKMAKAWLLDMHPHFLFPVLQQGCGRHDKNGTALARLWMGGVFLQPGEEGDRLKRLAEPLLISIQDSGQAGFPALCLPYETILLMSLERGSDEMR